MIAWRKVLGGVLLCVSVALAMPGCAADASQLVYHSQKALTDCRGARRELVAQMRTTDALLANYRTCLAWGEAEEHCWREFAVYRGCLAAGGSDPQCETN